MLDDKQKRTFIALACKVAWADGVVTEEERASVAAIVSRLGGSPIAPTELDDWLVEADHDMSDAELRMIEDLVARVAKKHDPGTTVGKIAVVKRPL